MVAATAANKLRESIVSIDLKHHPPSSRSRRASVMLRGPFLSSCIMKSNIIIVSAAPTAASVSDENELLVWNEAKLPANVTEINPNLATIVYRVDPPDVLRAIAPFLVEYPAKMK